MPLNPALLVLRTRAELQDAYDREQDSLGRPGFPGRRFLEAGRMSEALRLRAQGLGDGEIERRLGLMQGAVSRMGGTDVVGIVDIGNTWDGEGRVEGR
jgi:helix-turn-helix protein